MVKIKLHNTLSNQKEIFEPMQDGRVTMYHCGPTVYNFPSIGNMRSYVLADTLRRTFEYFDYKVEQVINITDVGHLVGDGDLGEDKIEKSAKALGKTANEIAEFYEKAFHDDLAKLNIKTPGTKFPRASEHIAEQIEIIKLLEEKGFTYKTSDGLYFDTTKFAEYGKLGNINLTGLKEGARIDLGEKKNPTDFALWKFSKDTEEKRLQEWPSPWGVGFPGWHIECSAMSRKYLGQPFDIHTGGIDHIPVHHNNEIAQSECAFDTPLARFWLHNEFVKVDNEKMSKSLGNVYTLEDLKKRKIHPLAFRYWLLTSHYQTPANFTWEAVEGAQNALESIVIKYSQLTDAKDVVSNLHDNDLEQFESAIEDNLNTPIAIAVLQKASHRKTVDQIDRVLGLNIQKLAEEITEVPEEILEAKLERDRARENKDWHTSDRLRSEIEREGFVLEDKENTSIIRKTLASIIQCG